MSVKNGVKTF